MPQKHAQYPFFAQSEFFRGIACSVFGMMFVRVHEQFMARNRDVWIPVTTVRTVTPHEPYQYGEMLKSWFIDEPFTEASALVAEIQTPTFLF